MKHPEGATTTAESRLVSDELKQIIREHLNICMNTIRSNRSHQDHQDYHHQNETGVFFNLIKQNFQHIYTMINGVVSRSFKEINDIFILAKL